MNNFNIKNYNEDQLIQHINFVIDNKGNDMWVSRSKKMIVDNFDLIFYLIENDKIDTNNRDFIRSIFCYDNLERIFNDQSIPENKKKNILKYLKIFDDFSEEENSQQLGFLTMNILTYEQAKKKFFEPA